MRVRKYSERIELVKSGDVFVSDLEQYDRGDNDARNAAFRNAAVENLKISLMHLHLTRANSTARLRLAIEDTVEYLINLLDDLEGDADLEVDVDGEADARDLPRSDFESYLLCAENEAGWAQAKNLQISS